MTVGQLQEQMSNAEYVKWLMFYQVEAQQRQLEQLKSRG